MADNHRSRPVGSIMDHPAFGNYEFHQRLSEPFSALQAFHPEFSTEEIWEQLITGSDMFPSAPNDRFLCHEHDITLEEDSEDPLELQYHRTGSIDLMDLDTDEIFQIRNERRRENQVARGFQPEPAVVPSRPTEDLFANTSLDEPEFVSSEEPSECRASRAEDIQFVGLTAARFEDMLDEQNFERDRVMMFEARLEEELAELASNKLENPGLKAKVVAFADAWYVKDPEAHGKWQSFIFNAHKCSDTPSRIWSIAGLYHRGVPTELCTAVRDLCSNELITSDLALRVKQIQKELDYDGVQVPCSNRRMLDDDDTWNVGVSNIYPDQDVFFGDDYNLDIPNGISDLQAPEGKSGAALAQFIMANLETRKIIVQQGQNEDRRKGLKICFEKFLNKAIEMALLEFVELRGDHRTTPVPEDKRADIGALAHAHHALEDALSNVPLM